MGSRNHSPSYLVHQNSAYCFRLTVPPDIRPIVGIREIRYSLRTGFLGEAKSRARRMVGFAQEVFEKIRTGAYMPELKDAEIQALLRDYFRETLDSDEHDRVTGIPLDEETPKALMMGHDVLKDTYRQ